MKKKRYDTRGKKKQKVTRQDDAAQRITYLWGAAHLLAETSPSLSRFYTSTIKKIGRRINLSLDAQSVKRHICKNCYSLLLPGVGDTTAKHRLNPKRQSHLVVTCGHCASVRRFVNHESSPQSKKNRDGAAKIGGKRAETLAPEARNAASSCVTS